MLWKVCAITSGHKLTQHFKRKKREYGGNLIFIGVLLRNLNSCHHSWNYDFQSMAKTLKKNVQLLVMLSSGVLRLYNSTMVKNMQASPSLKDSRKQRFWKLFLKMCGIAVLHNDEKNKKNNPLDDSCWPQKLLG